MPRSQHLIQPIPSEGKYGEPHFSIQPTKLLDGLVPAFSLQSGDCRPVLFCAETPGMTLDSVKHEPVRSGEMEHDLPDAVPPWNGMRRGCLDGDACQYLEDGGTMPRFTLERPQHLLLEARQFLSHSD